MIVPSKTEAFAHALPEAMLCKVPVVATAIEGNLDAFVDGHSGLYADSTGASIAERVLSLLDDPARSARMAEAAHRRARLLFDLDVTLPALSAAVRRTIESAYAGDRHAVRLHAATRADT
jgi:glycosyltransferase involved in cell wall biosynthesis